MKKLLKQAVVVVPATLMEYWKSEIKRWTPKNSSPEIVILNQDVKKRQALILNNKYKENIVFITTANVIFKHVDDFARNAKLDVLIVDEGHKAKNINTRMRQGIKNLYVRRHKIILTGTPVQNNLTEFYSLMDIVEDDILGTPSDFAEKFRSKIEAGLKKKALFKNMIRAQELI
jgi:SNF2 family DNA or RNA helicase